MNKVHEFIEKNEKVLKIIQFSLSIISIVLSFIFSKLNINTYIDIALVAIVLCGLPILWEAFEALIKEHDITADFLVALALIGSLILQEWLAAAEIAVIMEIGELIEEFTNDKAKAGISKLIDLTPKKATRLVKNNIEETILVDDIKVDDIVIVHAGEIIPVDGIVVEGETSINQATLTGESLPIYKTLNDNVLSGTMNIDGVIKIKVTHNAKDSSIQRMIAIANNADNNKARIVKKANKWAVILVCASLLTSIITGVVVGILNNSFWEGFRRAVTVLVVFCPCAFVLATPTAIAAGIGNATRHGVIIQSGEALERLSECDIAVFDKTGTLTKGEPYLTDIINNSSFGNDELLGILASGEKLSKHPLSQAIIKAYNKDYKEVMNHKSISGKGIVYQIDNITYIAGNDKLMKEYNINIQKHNGEGSIIYLATEKELLGSFVTKDKIREGTITSISELKQMGITPIMMTGDHQKEADALAQQLGIEQVYADCSPDDKMNYINTLEEQGHKVAMFGDGVNDALALKRAYTSVAIGSLGNDVAISNSDSVLVQDDIANIPYLFFIARKTSKRISFNLILSMVINIVAIVLAILNIMDTVMGAIYHNIGSIAIVISALQLLLTKYKKK